MNLLVNRPPVSYVSFLCPHLTVQNGVVENVGAPSAAPNAASGAKPISLKTENELGDRSDEVDSSPRVSRVKPERKGLGLDSGFHSSDDDGSLPTSPDSESCIPEFPTEETELERETRELIVSLYRSNTGLLRSERRPHKALQTMRKVVNHVSTKHEITFKGMVNRVDLDDLAENKSFLKAVAESTFSDGTTNWGRIATLVAFGAVLTQHLKASGRPECVETVAEEISSYLANQKYDWLLNNNGWQGFVDFFHVEDPEAVVRNTLIAVAGFASLGAGLAFLIR